MEIKIHGYKRNGIAYEVRLNWNRNPVGNGIGGGHIDKLEIRRKGERKIICRYDSRWITPPGSDLALHEVASEMIERFN